MTDRWKTRRTVIQRAKDPNDEHAWNDFVQFYESFIHLVLRKMQFRESDIDDITQEILLKIWRYLSKFESDEKRAQFRTWLSLLIRNQAINYIKTNLNYENRQNVAADFYKEQDIMPSTSLDHLVQEEWELHLTTKALENVKQLFSGRAVEAFEMLLAGKSTKEISESLGIKQNSVLTLTNRVKLRMANEVLHLQEMLEF